MYGNRPQALIDITDVMREFWLQGSIWEVLAITPVPEDFQHIILINKRGRTNECHMFNTTEKAGLLYSRTFPVNVQKS